MYARRRTSSRSESEAQKDAANFQTTVGTLAGRLPCIRPLDRKKHSGRHFQICDVAKEHSDTREREGSPSGSCCYFYERLDNLMVILNESSQEGAIQSLRVYRIGLDRAGLSKRRSANASESVYRPGQQNERARRKLTLVMVILPLVLPESDPMPSTCLTTSMPLTTSPEVR